MKLQCLKLFIITKTKKKKKKILEDFREISVLGSLKSFLLFDAKQITLILKNLN